MILSICEFFVCKFDGSAVCASGLRIDQQDTDGIASMKKECKLMLSLRHPCSTPMSRSALLEILKFS